MRPDEHTRDEVMALVRELRAQLDDARARYPEAQPVASDDDDSDDPETPSFRDEDGDERALPLEFATATMGHVLLGQERRDEALAVFRAVLSRAPDDADALRGLALLDAPSTVTAS